MSCRLTIDKMRGRLVLLQRELKIIAVAAMLEHLQFVMRRGNQFAVLVQVADGMIELSFGHSQIVPGIGNVGAHLYYFTLHAGNFIVHRANLLLGGFFIGLQASLSFMLFGLEFLGLLAQFFMVHSRAVRQHVE